MRRVDVAKGTKSRNHHWWPVSLQGYWSDKNGNVSWIDPEGNVGSKKPANRKIGFKAHGHTLFRGDVWGETNFEDEFNIDNEVHRLVETLSRLHPLGGSISALQSWWMSVRGTDRRLTDFCAIHHVDEQISRDLLLLIFSLLIRSPAYRFTYETFPARFGLPISENVGKVNMRQNYLIAKRLCQRGVMTNRFFLVLRSDHHHFIYGDGFLDRLSGSLQTGRVSGCALIPLTPTLCVYICTPTAMISGRNCAVVRAAPWMVEQANHITQIYSRDRLFFLGRKPTLTEHFEKRQFLSYGDRHVDLLENLDEIARPRSRWGGFHSGKLNLTS